MTGQRSGHRVQPGHRVQVDPTQMRILTLTNCLVKKHCPLAQARDHYFKFCPGVYACETVVGTMRYAEHLYEIGWPDEEAEV